MRTTIDLEDTLFRQVKSRASLKGLSLKRFVEQALKQSLREAEKFELSNSKALEQRRIKLPVISSRHKTKSKIRLSNAQIEDLLA